MWHYRYIDDPKEAFLTSHKFMDAVWWSAAIRGLPDVAVFSRFDEETGSVHFYFSPQTQAVAISHGASPCEKPSRQNLGSLLAGDQTLIDRLFRRPQA